MRKKSPEEFGDENCTQASYTIAMVIRDCCPEVQRNLSMRSYLYPCANYIFHPFVVYVRVGGARSGWWYALRRSMRDEPAEPIKIQTNPISFFCSGFWGLEKLNHCPAVLMYIDLISLHHNRVFPWLLHLKNNQLVQRDDKCESHGVNRVSTAPGPFKYLLGCMFFVDTPQKVNTLVLEPSTYLSSSTNCSGGEMSSNPQSYLSGVRRK